MRGPSEFTGLHWTHRRYGAERSNHVAHLNIQKDWLNQFDFNLKISYPRHLRCRFLFEMLLSRGLNWITSMISINWNSSKPTKFFECAGETSKIDFVFPYSHPQVLYQNDCRQFAEHGQDSCHFCGLKHLPSCNQRSDVLQFVQEFHRSRWVKSWVFERKQNV